MSEETTGNTPDSASQRLAGIQLAGLRGRIVRSRDLFGDEDRVLINHNGRLYMLRIVARGGLRLEAVTAGSNPSRF
jgi:hemin uptake protein HemP